MMISLYGKGHIPMAYGAVNMAKIRVFEVELT